MKNKIVGIVVLILVSVWLSGLDKRGHYKFKRFEEFVPLVSPFSDTTIDKIDANIEIRRKKILGE